MLLEKLISRELLAKVANSNLHESIRLFSENKEQRIRSKYSFETSAFLSHKHDEIEIIQDVVTLLVKLYVDVYIDWLDEGMSRNTNAGTTARIKEMTNKVINIFS